MAETGDIGPGGLIPYGARVEALDIEHYHSADPAAWLTGLFRSVLHFIVRWGDDAEVCSGILRSITAIRGAYSDRSEILKPQLEVLAKLKTHSSPFVQDMIYRAEEALLKEMKERA